MCPAIPADLRTIIGDPKRTVETLVALEAKREALTALVAAHVDRTGKDVVTDAGDAFGTGKPKRASKPRKSLYTLTKGGTDGSDDTDGE